MWKKNFSEKILEESYEYFKADLVNDFICSQSNVSACVGGYNVSIDFKDSQITSMYCYCRSHHCIHQATALYYLDNQTRND